jgi:hypothetical protein
MKAKLPEQSLGRIRWRKFRRKLRRISTPAFFLQYAVAIDVLESGEKPVFFRDAAYKRVGRANRKISAGEIRNLDKDSGEKVYRDEMICESAAPEDIVMDAGWQHNPGEIRMVMEPVKNGEADNSNRLKIYKRNLYSRIPEIRDERTERSYGNILRERIRHTVLFSCILR